MPRPSRSIACLAALGLTVAGMSLSARGADVLFTNYFPDYPYPGRVGFLGDFRPGPPLGCGGLLEGTNWLAQLAIRDARGNWKPVGPIVTFQSGHMAGYIWPTNVAIPEEDIIPGSFGPARMQVWARELGQSYEQAVSRYSLPYYAQSEWFYIHPLPEGHVPQPPTPFQSFDVPNILGALLPARILSSRLESNSLVLTVYDLQNGGKALETSQDLRTWTAAATYFGGGCPNLLTFAVPTTNGSIFYRIKRLWP